jgi:hypothetical protein
VSDQIRINPNCVIRCCTTRCDAKIVFRVNRPLLWKCLAGQKSRKIIVTGKWNYICRYTCAYVHIQMKVSYSPTGASYNLSQTYVCAFFIAARNRVTRCVCEKVAQSVAQSIVCENDYVTAEKISQSFVLVLWFRKKSPKQTVTQ